MMTEAICDHATWVCYEVAKRDLGDTPLYIVPNSRLEHYPGKLEVVGFTDPSLDLYLKEQIPDWRGRGPCMVVNDIALRAHGWAFQIDFVGIALHELAHILQRDTPYEPRERATPEVLKREGDYVAAIMSNENPVYGKNAANPFLTNHAAKFLRIAFHLHHRAVAIGEPLIAGLIVDTGSYGLSAPKCYADAIAEEADRMRDATFREILATKFPEAFSRLWTDDAVRWLHSQTEKEAVTNESERTVGTDFFAATPA